MLVLNFPKLDPGIGSEDQHFSCASVICTDIPALFIRHILQAVSVNWLSHSRRAAKVSTLFSLIFAGS